MNFGGSVDSVTLTLLFGPFDFALPRPERAANFYACKLGIDDDLDLMVFGFLSGLPSRSQERYFYRTR